MQQVLILLGKARSGKDTVADFLAEKFGFKKFVFSSVLEEELKKQGKEVSKKNMVLLGDELREKYGMGIIAKQLLKKVVSKPEEEKIVFVGARSIEEVELIQEKFPQAKLILVEAEENKRFDRRSSIDPDELKEFSFRDKVDEEKKGMQKVFLLAEFKIENNGSIKDLFHKTSNLMDNLFK